MVHASHSLCEHNYCLHMGQNSLIRKDVDPVTPLPQHTHTLLFSPTSVGPSSCFHLENGSLHPQAGARLTPLHSGVAEVSLGGRELSAQSPIEEGDPRLTGSLEQSLEHWVSHEG